MDDIDYLREEIDRLNSEDRKVEIIKEFLSQHILIELYEYDTSTIDGLHSALSEAMIGK
jgi:hypothetical protein